MVRYMCAMPTFITDVFHHDTKETQKVYLKYMYRIYILSMEGLVSGIPNGLGARSIPVDRL